MLKGGELIDVRNILNASLASWMVSATRSEVDLTEVHPLPCLGVECFTLRCLLSSKSSNLGSVSAETVSSSVVSVKALQASRSMVSSAFDRASMGSHCTILSRAGCVYLLYEYIRCSLVKE